ncbi:MAG TPA: hypothetical protein VGM05_22810, partial [Planctomycetaceae bacterium]
MHLPSWRQIIARISTWSARNAPRDAGRSGFAKLSMRRLEDRRMLSGAPVGMGVTVEDLQGALIVTAGVSGGGTVQNSGTGQAIDLALESKDGRIELELTSNGTILYEEEFDKIASLTFKSTAGNDSLIIDFSHGDPIPGGGVIFVGAGTAQPGSPGDSLQIINGTVDSVAYSMSNLTGGQIEISSGSQNSSITYSGADQITDELIAASRSLTIGSGISQVQISPDSVAAGMSQLGLAAGTTVDFSNPSSSLSVTADPQTATTIDVQGLDGGFSASLNITAGAAGSTVDFTAPTSLGIGSLYVWTDNIFVDAPISSTGGMIELSATTQILIASTGGLSTNASTINLAAPLIDQQGTIIDSDGGTVLLDAGDEGTLLDSGVIDASASGADEIGGSVDLFGEYVGLTGQAVVNVSGSDGGGSVLIGGDYQGANPGILNAARTYVGTGVVIDADAVVSGDGGRVIVWSEEVTRFYGEIDALGGGTGGDGGFAEISSHLALTELGTVNLAAANGLMGSLLLDPLTITIVDKSIVGADDGQLAANVPIGEAAGAVLFADSSTNNFTISEAQLEASTANLILQARNSITIDNLTTDGTILLKNNVNITLETRNDTTQGDSATGGITFVNTANGIQTQGTGTITLEAGVTANAAGTISSRQGTASITAGALTTAGGAITVEASGAVTLNSAVKSSAGAVTLTADSTGTGTGTLSVASGVSVNTAGGALNVTAADLNLAGSLNSGNGTTTISTDKAETIGVGLATGNLTIDGGELSRITAAMLVVGSGKTTGITVDGVTSAQSQNIGLVSLNAGATGGTISFVTDDSTFQSLSAMAQDNITFDAGRTENAVATLGSITLNPLTGSITDTGALTLQAKNGIKLGSNVTTGGALTVNADTDASGAGAFTVANGTTVSTTNSALSITAADVNLGGSLNSGIATTTITTAANETIGLGLATGSNLTIDGGELSRITAATLMVGSGPVTSIAVDGVTSAQSQNIGLLTLQALATGGTISFVTDPSTFQSLSAIANNGIAVQANVTTNGTLTVDSDKDADGSGTFTVAATKTVTTTNSALNITAADVNLAGSLNSGNGTTTISTDKAETIGVGLATGNLTIDGGEL